MELWKHNLSWVKEKNGKRKNQQQNLDNLRCFALKCNKAIVRKESGVQGRLYFEDKKNKSKFSYMTQ